MFTSASCGERRNLLDGSGLGGCSLQLGVSRRVFS